MYTKSFIFEPSFSEWLVKYYKSIENIVQSWQFTKRLDALLNYIWCKIITIMSLTPAATCSLNMENCVQLSGSTLYNYWNVLLYIILQFILEYYQLFDFILYKLSNQRNKCDHIFRISQMKIAKGKVFALYHDQKD